LAPIKLCFQEKDNFGKTTTTLSFQLGDQSEFLDVAGGVVHQLSKQHRSASRQGPPRPPEVQGGGMPVPDALLPRRGGVGLLQPQGDLNEFLEGGGHGRVREHRFGMGALFNSSIWVCNSGKNKYNHK